VGVEGKQTPRRLKDEKKKGSLRGKGAGRCPTTSFGGGNLKGSEVKRRCKMLGSTPDFGSRAGRVLKGTEKGGEGGSPKNRETRPGRGVGTSLSSWIDGEEN